MLIIFVFLQVPTNSIYYCWPGLQKARQTSRRTWYSANKKLIMNLVIRTATLTGMLCLDLVLHSLGLA